MNFKNCKFPKKNKNKKPHYSLIFSYVDDSRREIGILNKYPELVEEETELLIKELRQFLYAFPKEITEIRRASRYALGESPSVQLPIQMRMCEFEVLALDNWLLG